MSESKLTNNTGRFESWSQEMLLQLQSLNNKFDNLTKDNENIKNSIHELKTSLEAKIENLNIIISGNGNPEKGLIVRTTLLEQSNKEFYEFIDESKDNKKWITRSTIGTALTAICSLAVVLFKTFVK